MQRVIINDSIQDFTTAEPSKEESDSKHQLPKKNLTENVGITPETPNYFQRRKTRPDEFLEKTRVKGLSLFIQKNPA